MLLLKLRGLEIRGQLLFDCLLDHTLSGKPDNGAGLGDDDVSQRRKTRHGASRGGVCQNADKGDRLFLHLRAKDGCLGHLHEGKNALVHARAAAAGQRDAWHFLFQRQLHRAGDFFPRGAPHGATHEEEVHDRKRNGDFADLRRSCHHGFAGSRFLVLDLNVVGIVHAALKIERVGWAEFLMSLLERLLVHDLADTLMGGNSLVAATGRADRQALLKVLSKSQCCAAGATIPEILRDALAHVFALRPGDVDIFW